MADRKSQELVERMVDGFLQYDYTETWQVAASGIASALQVAGLPQIGQPYILSGVDSPVYCYSRQPRRRNDQQAKTIFDVVCNFTNAVNRYERTVDGLPATQPESIVPRVDIAFEEYSEPSGSAQFLGIFDASTPASQISPLATRIIPPYLPQPQFGVEVSVVNSANDPVQNINKRGHTKRITYWTWHRDWSSSWDNYLDTINDATVTISQYDQDGIRLRYSFDPYTLLINDIVKEDHWRDGRLFFRRGIVFSHKPGTWFTEITDAGFNEMYFAFQLKQDGSQITPSEMDDWFGTDRATHEQVPITVLKPVENSDLALDLTQVAVADPVALNGYGRQVKFPTPDGPELQPKKLVYLTYTATDFSQLGIS